MGLSFASWQIPGFGESGRPWITSCNIGDIIVTNLRTASHLSAHPLKTSMRVRTGSARSCQVIKVSGVRGRLIQVSQRRVDSKRYGAEGHAFTVLWLCCAVPSQLMMELLAAFTLEEHIRSQTHQPEYGLKLSASQSLSFVASAVPTMWWTVGALIRILTNTGGHWIRRLSPTSPRCPYQKFPVSRIHVALS